MSPESRAAITSFVIPTAAETVVPVHSDGTLGPGLPAAILRDCEIERGDFIALL
jgi:hypothetical protein